MKALKIFSGTVSLIILIASTAYSQKQFTHTVTAKNKYCNSSCSLIDIPELNNNPVAILIITPLLENVRNLNPHPVGAYYAEPKKWSIINVDGSAISEGAKFNVQYYPSPDSNQFVYVIPKQGVIPCIDHARLNENPNSKIRFSATGSPKGSYFNKYEVKIEYDASVRKWCIASVNNEPVRSETAFNIAISSETASGANIGTGPIIPTLPTGTPYVPAGSQTFVSTPLAPITVVVREEWTIPFQSNVALGPGYCTVINGGYANPAILMTDSVVVTGQQYGQGANLRWTAEAGNGSLTITVCNNGNSVYGSSAQTHVNDKKINILVLR